jgi:hypothetical protein
VERGASGRVNAGLMLAVANPQRNPQSHGP